VNSSWALSRSPPIAGRAARKVIHPPLGSDPPGSIKAVKQQLTGTRLHELLIGEAIGFRCAA
jgi:hypothetical protein